MVADAVLVQEMPGRRVVMLNNKINRLIYRIITIIFLAFNNAAYLNLAFASDKCPTIRYNGILNAKETIEEQLKIIQEASDCIGQKNQNRVGKWVCLVQNMVGIQNQENNINSIYAGQIKPTNDKFFFNIERTLQDTKAFYCKRAFGTETMSLDENPCIENFTGKSKSFFGASVDGYVLDSHTKCNFH